MYRALVVVVMLVTPMMAQQTAVGNPKRIDPKSTAPVQTQKSSPSPAQLTKEEVLELQLNKSQMQSVVLEKTVIAQRENELRMQLGGLIQKQETKHPGMTVDPRTLSLVPKSASPVPAAPE